MNEQLRPRTSYPILFILFCIAVVVLALPLFAPTPCTSVVTYRIDQADSRFNITDQEFQTAVQEATNVWEGPLHHQFFRADKNGQLIIRLTYDERQSLSNELQKEVEQISQKEQNHTVLLNQYQQRKAAFQANLQAYNKEVASWNSKGGAPDDVYQKLAAKEEALRNEADAIAALGKSVNAAASDYNSLAGQVNALNSQYVETRNEKPEEGVFDEASNTIDVYHFTTTEELVHTLAHELGHALELDHVSNPNALMYRLSNSTQSLTEDDVTALNTRCHPQGLVTRWQQGFEEWAKRATIGSR